jgi:hypothetical protein
LYFRQSLIIILRIIHLNQIWGKKLITNNIILKNWMVQNTIVKTFLQTLFLRMNFPKMWSKWRQNMPCTKHYLVTSNLKNAKSKFAQHVAKMPTEHYVACTALAKLEKHWKLWSTSSYQFQVLDSLYFYITNLTRLAVEYAETFYC